MFYLLQIELKKQKYIKRKAHTGKCQPSAVLKLCICVLNLSMTPPFYHQLFPGSAKHSSYCFSTLWSKYGLLVLPKSKKYFTSSGERWVHGGTPHTHTHSTSVNTARSPTLTPNIHIYLNLHGVLIPRHDCVKCTRTQKYRQRFKDRTTQGAPVLIFKWSNLTDFIFYTRVCLEFSFSFLCEGDIFLLNWLKLAALHLTLGPSPNLSELCLGSGGRVL